MVEDLAPSSPTASHLSLVSEGGGVGGGGGERMWTNADEAECRGALVRESGRQSNMGELVSFQSRSDRKMRAHGNRDRIENMSPYNTSLDGIARVYQDLQGDREFLIKESEKMYKERVQAVSRLRKLEAKLMDLSQEKMSLEEKIEGLGLRDEELRQKILNLDEKVAKISEESQRFEYAIREMRGERVNALQSGASSYRPQHVSSSSCLRTLYGHSGHVICVDACPESRTIITGSSDKSLRTWDLDTGRRQEALYGHNGWVHSVSLHEYKAVSASGDKTIKIWDFSPVGDEIGYGVGVAGPCRATLIGHEAGVTCVDFDDQAIISGSMDRTIRRWDAENHTADVFVLTGHDAAVTCLEFWSYAIASGSADKAIRMWDLRTGRCHRLLRGHSATVRSLQFDDRLVISGGLDKKVLIWDIRTGKTIISVDVPAQVNGLSFEGDQCLVAAADNIVYVYEVSSGALMKQHFGHSGPVTCASQAEGKAISGSSDQTCRVWL